MTFPTSPFPSEITTNDIVSAMSSCHSWEDKYRKVIQWSKKLPKMPDELKTEELMVAGCESQIWLVSKFEDGKWHFCADSDARIVRGLIALVMAAYNEKTAEEIQTFDIDGYFEQLGLIEHLSASRGNGLRAIVDKIKQLSNITP
ncbi:cysteine desulfurase sulfur acceptor subunit CsdE [Vibrio sp. JC009]|uniref:cysteine desulfurase sulfur acceptor subunit CsdE n=1 Tax=Vibrio sp. JC009 TaxID=2912314 RepID=UPI0023B1C482|nr:cysteine desulfurase sulfur acceptor subunit CsdE [Vibrio sp. JC009]WED21239.1 cysteine desulfurase sulfur acceptor subunit CsdE [Vibrio sp. JC009]